MNTLYWQGEFGFTELSFFSFKMIIDSGSYMIGMINGSLLVAVVTLILFIDSKIKELSQ